jgi:hypothetical protein
MPPRSKYRLSARPKPTAISVLLSEPENSMNQSFFYFSKRTSRVGAIQGPSDRICPVFRPSAIRACPWRIASFSDWRFDFRIIIKEIRFFDPETAYYFLCGAISLPAIILSLHRTE